MSERIDLGLIHFHSCLTCDISFKFKIVTDKDKKIFIECDNCTDRRTLDDLKLDYGD